MKRREFLQGSLALAAAAQAPLAAVASPEAKPVVRKYGVLGKTGLSMSDISFGAGKLPSASLILRAVDRGVTYIDTAPDYGQSEEHIGEALGKLKERREKLVIASKFCRQGAYPGHLPLGSSREEYVRSVEESLKRLRTDHLDLVFVHAIGEHKDLELEKKRMLDDNMLAAFDALQRAGKVKHLAVSSHGPHNLESLLTEAVASGHFQVIMAAFNFLKFPGIPAVLKQASEKGVGVVAMKTLAGAKEMGLEAGGIPFEHAAFKWVLKHPEVAGLVITIQKVEELDLYLAASGKAYTAGDQRVLDHYAALHGAEYCRTGCDACEAACPAGVEVGAILRHRMYFEDYGDEKRAMLGYAALEKKADACWSCADDPCAGMCSHGLQVGQKLRAAHRALSFA